MTLPTIPIPKFDGTSQTVYTANSGRQQAADSAATVLSNEDKTALDAVGTKLDTLINIGNGTTPSAVELPGDWNRAAASSTQALGAAGVAGDYLSHVTIIPSSLSPGAVQIKDGSGTATDIFAGGTNSLTSLAPFSVALGMKSKVGGWSIITNAGATAYGVGDFT